MLDAIVNCQRLLNSSSCRHAVEHTRCGRPGRLLSSFQGSSNGDTYNTANATEAVDSDLGGHVGYAWEILSNGSR
jgi:hypothetical protein